MSDGGNGELPDRKKVKLTWKQAWHEFCSNTTIHGLRQVGDYQPYVARRICWSLLVLTGLGFFVYQMMTGIFYYYKHPVSVNMELNYNESISFPAVTICNHNAFRMTVAHQHGLYPLLSSMYSGDSAVNHTANNNDVTDLDLYQIYNITGQEKEDLIVRCTWDGKSCSTDDFVMTMTDYGKCYTFNFDSEERRQAWRTGAEGGLRLLLNIEQYEYMHGPNSGAGVRIHIYEPSEVPMVKDFGISFPPGSHSLLGITMVHIKNLPLPYGRCVKDKRLRSSSVYTKLNCLEECKQNRLESNCSCRHINMKENKAGKPYCNVAQYQSCGILTENEFNFNHSACDCPSQCELQTFRGFSSESKISVFDALTLLNSPLTSALEVQLLRATEVRQRVNRKVVQDDKAIIGSFKHTFDEVEHFMDDILKAMLSVEQSVQKKLLVLNKRIKFHKIKGLDNVKYIMEHDFVRGWTIIEERTLPYLTSGFYELRTTYRRTINQLQMDLNGTDQQRLLALAAWQQMERICLGRLDILRRASDNISEIHESYKSGKPLLTYKSSLDRRYDMTWITIDILQAVVDDGNHNQNSFYRKVVSAFEMINTTLRTYLDMGKSVINGTEIDENLWDDTDVLFRKGCVNYNYYLFLYKERIVKAPVEVIDAKIKEFDLLNRTLGTARDSLLTTTKMLRRTILTLKQDSWPKIKKVLTDAMEYLSNEDKLKKELALDIKSKVVTESMEDLKQIFSVIRTSTLTLREKIQNLQNVIQDIWLNMLNEYTTSRFYEKVSDDFLAFQNDSSYYVPYFADLLDADNQVVYNLSAYEIEYSLNADFARIDSRDQIQSLQPFFDDLRDKADVAHILMNKDESLLVAFRAYGRSLESFTRHTIITTSFYQENFMQLDVFMQELSYQEIIQQPAYDTLSLFGDIGGSIGLFLGASAITLVEIFDAFFIQLLRLN